MSSSWIQPSTRDFQKPWRSSRTSMTGPLGSGFQQVLHVPHAQLCLAEPQGIHGPTSVVETRLARACGW